MRLRINDDSTTNGQARTYSEINRVVQMNVPYTYPVSQKFMAMQDVVTPDWKERVGKGEILNNRMISQTLVYSSVPVYLKTTGTYNSSMPALMESTLQGTSARGSLTLPEQFKKFTGFTDEYLFSEYLDEFNDERDIAIAKAFANVSKSEFQMLASLGEMPETLKWIKSIFERAIKLIKGIKTFNLKLIRQAYTKEGLGSRGTLEKLTKALKPGDKSSVLKHVADPWLEYRYAIRPLIYEMKSAVEALKAVIRKGTRFTARGFNDDRTVTITSDRYSYAGWIRFETRRLSRTHARNYRAGVLSSIDDDIDSIMAIWGFDQPFQSAWELVPFSFIIDWFFNVGTIIGAWSPKASLTALSSWVTEQHLFEEEIRLWNPVSITSLPLYWNKIEYNTDNYYRWATTIKRRLPSPDVPILPSFNLRLDTAKIADLAAIGYGLLLGSPSVTVAKRA